MSNLIPWSDRGELGSLRREMDRLFDRFFDWRLLRRTGLEGEWAPLVDLSENKKEVILKAEIPGMEAKDIDISLDGNVLTIRGEKKKETETKEENYHRVERSYGSFSRAIRLPAEVDDNTVDAAYKDGVLYITLTKTKKDASKKIEIKAK
jgi:HSP20 family protein